MEPLTPARWHRVRALFDQVAELPVDERHDFLQKACQDAALRTEVEALLRAEAEGDLLEGPVHQAAPGLVAEMGVERETGAAASLAGMQVGPYRLLEEIGRGGMSVVYLAERADGQFQQHVALKLIKRGMDADVVVQRFLRERQILARLQHPGIARLYDGGLTDDGQPFFAMEYVPGEPITADADLHRLGIDDRLRRFLRVCEAVAFAHRNLVVHRDLKPSNVLVTEVDQVPQVKLLDFGIAKLLDDDPDAAALTQTGMRVLTPAYAAPEQVEGGSVTTLTDVFALGALLYELLTGRRASGTADTATTAPPRPSTVVQHPFEHREADGTHRVVAAEAVAEMRGLTAERLQRRLAGDLDTICLKALRREPERRYASVEELADDVHRHLERRPVRARPDTLAYRARRFVARHRTGVAAAVIVTLSLLFGLGAALWQAGVARQERDEKRVEAARATATLDYMLGLFDDLDPVEAQGRRFTARDLITPGLRRLEDLRGQPLEYAAVAQRLGQLSSALGQFTLADSLLVQAQAIQERHLPPDAPELAETMEQRAKGLQGQSRYAEAETLLEQALLIRRRLGSTGTGGGALVQTLNQIAHVRLNREAFDEAEAAYTEALALQQEDRRLTSPDRAGAELTERPRSRRGLAEVYTHTGKAEEAIPLFEEALAEYTRLVGASHTETARVRFSLARAHQELGNFDRADSLLQISLQAYRRVYGNDNHQVGALLANLGNVWRDAGDEEQALQYYEQAVATYEQAFPGPYLHKALALEKVGTLRMARGDLDGAEPALRQAYAMTQALGDADPIRLPRMRLVLAGCLFRRGGHEEAYALLRTNHTAGVCGSPDTGEALTLCTQTLRGLSRIAENLGRGEAAARYEREMEALSADGQVDGPQ